MLVAITADAKGRYKGSPSSVVFVHEVGGRTHLKSVEFCPVTGKSFQQFCKRNQKYKFQNGIISSDADWVKAGKLKYMIHWGQAKTPGRYAWVKSQAGGFTEYYLEQGKPQETLLADIGPGTVFIESFYIKGSKAERDAAVRRVKAIFTQKYGDLVKQMKFVHLRVAPVMCLKPKQAPKNGYNCSLQ
ncbi:hypothetical protein [Roseovarius aestuarii]|nr:hypothetical protein [Roseovarius aestuarii]